MSKRLSFCLILSLASLVFGSQPWTRWSDYGGSSDSMQYSALRQINKSNVKQLQLVWSVKSPGPAGRFSFNPLIVDGVMYVVGKDSSIYAFDAATGRQIWVHPVEGHPTNRGFNYWESKDRKDQRLIFAADGYLQEINLKTGVTIPSFGNDGRVNLREGLGRDPKSIGEIQSGTPGRVFENLIILGSAPGEMYGSPPGDIRAYDVHTGKPAWTFHTVPHPGEFGYDTWPPEAWKYIGGNNTWGELSLDEKRGIAYFPLGSPTYDLYGADRTGANLFGDCLLTLDARTGKRLWHFQFVHHDLWDYDPTAAPKLLTVKHDGKNVDVVAQATKFGFLYVFDRVTGKPLWPIEERSAPQSDMPGEHSWPTQPFPTAPPPFARQKFGPDDINPYLEPGERERLRDLVANVSNKGTYATSFSRNQIAVPENGGAVGQHCRGSHKRHALRTRLTLSSHSQDDGNGAAQQVAAGNRPEQIGHALYMQHCVGCHGPDRERIPLPREMGMERFAAALRSGKGEMPSFSEATLTPPNVESLAAYLRNPAGGTEPSTAVRVKPPVPPPPAGQTRFYGPFGNILRASNGLIAFSPPWSSLVAYDLNTGTIKWRRPIGTTPGLAAKGIKDTGSSAFIRNGPVVTAGGLLIIGTGPDRMVHALDKDTGDTLWEAELDANPDGIPAIYEVAGRQYIAFFAAASGAKDTLAYKSAKPDSQGYYVFTL
jgi:quinoprotein glucose dehydrogenase